MSDPRLTALEQQGEDHEVRITNSETALKAVAQSVSELSTQIAPISKFFERMQGGAVAVKWLFYGIAGLVTFLLGVIALGQKIAGWLPK